MASFSSEDVEKVVAGTEALKVEEVVLATTHSQEAAAITTATTTPATEEHKKENTAVETPLPLIIPEEDTKKEEVKPESQASSSSSSSSPIKSKPPHLVGDEVPATPNTKRSMREGQFGHLTPTQEEALQHFQIQAKPSDLAAAKYTVETVQQCALRFLRARGFDVVKALVLLSECNQKLTEMRAAHWASCDPDTTLNCDTAALRNFYPHIQRGFDKFNRPILFEHTGGMNPTAVLQMTSKQGLINYHFWCMETSLDQKFTDAANRAESTHDNPDGTTIHNISTCVVLDFKDLGMQHVSQKMLDQMKMYIGLDNTCYPELLGKMFVINAPFLAVQTWGMVKRWLDPRTQSKIEILGPGPETLRRLHEFISPDQLPQAYGGTGPDIYERKPNCEATSVPRAGKLQKTIAVGANTSLTVDSYVSDGPIEITITFTSPSSTQGSARSPQVQGLCPPITIKPPANPEDGPSRHVQVIPSSTEPREITVTWANPAKFSSKPLVYVFTLANE